MEIPLPAYKGSGSYVFISYSHEDGSAVYEEIRWLQGQLVNVWYDEGIGPGSEWSDALASAIKGCQHFVYFITPRSVASENCRRELNFALAEQKQVIAVHLEKTEVPDGMRLNLDNRQAILAYSMDLAALRGKLAEVLSFANSHVQQEPERREPMRKKPLIVSLVAAFIAIVVGGVLVQRGQEVSIDPDALTESIIQETDPRLVILPFENLTGREEDADLVSGLAMDIQSRLSNISSLVVVSDLAVQAELSEGVGANEVATRLRATSVLLGSVQSFGEQVRINVQLIDVESDTQVWANSYDGRLADVFAVQSEVSLAVAGALRASLVSGERSRIERQSTESLGAFRLYQRAKEIGGGTTPAKNALAIELLREAIALDEKYVDAHAQLAWLQKWSYALGDAAAMTEAIEHAQRALALDDQSANAHFAMGAVFGEQGRYRAAISEFRRAVTLNYSIEHALQDLSIFLAVTGQLEESLETAIRAVEVRPNNGNTRWHLAAPLLLLDPDFARRTLEKIIEELPKGPDRARAGPGLLMLDLAERRYDSARTRVQIVRELGYRFDYPESLLVAAYAFVSLGDWEAAREILEAQYVEAPDRIAGLFPVYYRIGTMLAFVLRQQGELERADDLLENEASRVYAIIDSGHESSLLPIQIASIHAIRGEVDLACDWLDQAHDAGFRAHAHLATHPMFANLRAKPRFLAVLTRMERDVARMHANAKRDGLLDQVDQILAGGILR